MMSLAGVHSARDVIPGDLDGMRETSARLMSQSWILEDIAVGLSQVPRSVTWEGTAGDRFHTTVARMPGVFMGVAEAHRQAASALDRHCDEVQIARQQVTRALDLWEYGERLRRQAPVDTSTRTTRAPDILGESRSDDDPGVQVRAEALMIVTVAQQRVAESAVTASGQVKLAETDLSSDSSFWDDVGGAWSDFWHGATDVGADVINGIMSFGNALIENPDILLEILAGLALIQGGLAAEGGGVVLDGTGVGAPAGIAVGAAGLAAIAAGAGMVANGIGRAATEAAGDSAVAPLQGVGRGGGGSAPAALDAAQVESKVNAATRPGRNSGVRVVDDENELRALFDELSVGGVDATPTTGAYAKGGKMVELPDGTTVGLRTTSTSGGPTIDITFPGNRLLKVHVK